MGFYYFYSFLKLHDKRHKRLWFLWNSGFDATRCGCIGGSAFFGNNINGPKFFKPSAQDIQDGINIARYKYVLHRILTSISNKFSSIYLIFSASIQIPKNTVLAKVFYTKINWYSTHHRTVCSPFHCKNAMNISEKRIFVCQNMMNRNHHIVLIRCAIIMYHRLKNVIDKMLEEIKMVDRRMYSIVKSENHPLRKSLHAN